jgi:hypothetical protein
VAVAQNGRFESFLVGPLAYRAGRFDRYQGGVILLIEYFWLIAPVVLLLAVVIAAWLRRTTERVAERRLAGLET